MQGEKEIVKTPQKIELKGVGGQEFITGTLITPEYQTGKISAVMFIHGMTSSEAGYLTLAERLARRGLACLTINLRGHGTSSGRFNDLTVDDLVRDGMFALEFLLSLPIVDKDRVGLCGSSLGAAIALVVSGWKKVKSLVLRAPAVYTMETMLRMKLDQIMEKQDSIFMDIDRPEQTMFAEMAARFTGELLIIASEYDQVIPQKIPQAIFFEATRAHEKKLIIIPGAGHVLCDLGQKEQFYSLTESWMRKHLL